MSGGAQERRGERRVAARHYARVRVGTAILDAKAGTASLGPLTLHGHTRDLSPSGLGLVIPYVDLGPSHSGEALPARVRVGLAGGGVEVEAEAVHWAPLSELGLGAGVLLGVRVTRGGEALAQFLSEQARS